MDATPVTSTTLDLHGIASRIRAAIAAAGVDATAYAAQIGVPYSTMRSYLSGNRAPSPEFLAGAMATWGLSPAWVLAGTGAMSAHPCAPDARVSNDGAPTLAADFAVIPVYSAVAAAGTGALGEPTAEYAVGGLCFSRSWLTERRLAVAGLRVISVRGASMEPLLSDGDKVLIDTAETTPRSGYVYVLRQGGELLVKYAQLLPGGVLRVSSANAAFAPYDVDLSRHDDVQIIGRVVASMHEW